MSRSRPTSAFEIVAGAWFLAALLTLVTADEVRTWLTTDDHLRDSAIADLGRAADELSGHLGLDAVRSRLNQVRGVLHGRDRAPAPPAPPPAAPAPAATPAPVAAAATSAAPGGHEVAPRASRILLIGASSMQFGLGPELETALGRYEGVTVQRFARSATGLSRPDEFEWPAKVDELCAKHKPDLVITNFGGNDAQAIPDGPRKWIDYGTPEWDAAYKARVAEIVRRARARGAHTVMIGMPVMRLPKFNERIVRLNRLMREATIEAGGSYLEQYDLSSTPEGRYREDVTVDGKRRLMRMADGIHYTGWGGRYVALKLLARLERAVRLVPRDPALGVLEGHRFTSPALGRTARYLAWLPKRPVGKLPLLVLLHGAGGSADDFSEHGHETMARLVQQHNVIIVAPDGGTASWYLDTEKEKVATFVARDLVADAAANLPVGDRRGIVGLSMGGHGALTLSLTLGGFAAASSISGVVDITAAHDRTALVERLGPLAQNRARWEASSAQHLVRAHPEKAKAIAIYLSVGTEDRWAPANRALHQLFTELGIAHDYDEAPAGHTWDYWMRTLPLHVAWHAKHLAKP